MKYAYSLVTLLATASLAGCVTTPNGPSNMALPGTGKDFSQFRHDDGACREFALTTIGEKTANQQYDASLAKTTAVGTVVGAAIGAAAGGGEGAAIGAGVGAVSGGAIGVGAAAESGQNAQQKYDNAYLQCMYGAGHRIPVPASMAQTYRQSAPSANATRYVPPPPPPAAKRLK